MEVFADGKIKKVDITGGMPVAICSAPSLNAASWGSAGTIVFAHSGLHGGAIQKVSETGGAASAATTLADGDSLHIRPTFLPDGRHFLFHANGRLNVRRVYLASLDSAERTLIFQGGDFSSNVVYADGHLLYGAVQTF